MARNRKPSKKRSAASSTAKLLEQTVFYLDESIYSRVLVEAMSAAGARLRTPPDAAGFGASDQQWLKFMSEANCVVLMRDQRIRYRELERNALSEACVGAFVFTGGQATAADTAEIICRLLPRLASINRSESKPFLYSFGLAGLLARIRLRR